MVSLISTFVILEYICYFHKYSKKNQYIEEEIIIKELF